MTLDGEFVHFPMKPITDVIRSQERSNTGK